MGLLNFEFATGENRHRVFSFFEWRAIFNFHFIETDFFGNSLAYPDLKTSPQLRL